MTRHIIPHVAMVELSMTRYLTIWNRFRWPTSTFYFEMMCSAFPLHKLSTKRCLRMCMELAGIHVLISNLVPSKHVNAWAASQAINSMQRHFWPQCSSFCNILFLSHVSDVCAKHSPRQEVGSFKDIQTVNMMRLNQYAHKLKNIHSAEH